MIFKIESEVSKYLASRLANSYYKLQTHHGQFTEGEVHKYDSYRIIGIVTSRL